MLKTCSYELWAKSVTGKLLNFTRFIISANLKWGLGASRAQAKITMSPQAKKQLMNVKRGSEFLLRWGWSDTNFTQVRLFWTGTTLELGDGATVAIDLVHGSWATTRTPTVGITVNAKAADVVKTAAISKGTKINTGNAEEPPSGANSKVVAVSQTIAEEIARQFKGQFIVPNKNGTTLDVVSFENLKSKAQVYYISTEVGFLDKMSITYKAKVPADKSYVSMLGGSGSPANADPASNPSAVSSIVEAVAPTIDLPTYAILQSTTGINKQKNPILSLSLYKDKQFLGLFQAVSGNAFRQDNKKLGNVLPNGNYKIASTTVLGSGTEVGGLFLAITPQFKTNRSELGIHLDPSFNKANGEDGTHGCIGLTTAADRDKVQKFILENKITTLIVDLGSKAEVKPAEPETVVKNAHLVVDLDSAVVYSEQSRRGKVKNIGSIFKIFIAMAVVNKQANLSTVFQGETLLSHLDKMLNQSNNEASNKLIDAVGGIEAMNRFCQKAGFLKTKLDSLYTNEIGLKQSTCQDLANAFKAIFAGSRYTALWQFLIGSSLGLTGEQYTKLGTNSGFEGGVSLVQNTAGKFTVIVILAENGKQVKDIVKQIDGKIP